MPDLFAGRGRTAGGGAEVGDDGAAPLEPRQPHGHSLVGALQVVQAVLQAASHLAQFVHGAHVLCKQKNDF